MKLFDGKRRGISTVVETALMLSAVAVLGSTLVMWSNSNLGSYETKLGNTANNNANKFNEVLSIENALFCQATCPHGITAPGANVTLTNVGTIGLNVTQIILNSTSTATSINSLNVAILPGQSYMWPKSSYNWQHRTPVTITVTTARGTIFTTQATPP
jgi:archaellum component FlaF (FlaF/FlaG flagellin family)